MTAELPQRVWVDLERFEWVAATPNQALLRVYGICALPADETDVHARMVVEEEPSGAGHQELLLVQKFSLRRRERDVGDPPGVVVGRWSCAFSAPPELLQRAANRFVLELDGWTRIPLPAPTERPLRAVRASRRSDSPAAPRAIGTRLGRGALGVFAGALMGLLAWVAVDLIAGHGPRPTPLAAAQPVPARPLVSNATSARAVVVPHSPSLVAWATVARVPVYRSATASAPTRVLSNPNSDGARLVLLVVESGQRGRLRVMLPTRPNLSQGWIPREDVRLAIDPYRLLVRLQRHVMTIWRGSRLLERIPVGVGRAAVTPTPSGLYYITELLKQPDPGGAYGPYAFGLSAHSPVLHDFAGGNGQIGVHGTNQPWTIGHDVSHGCIRVYNAVITRLARELPLGTPVLVEN